MKLFLGFALVATVIGQTVEYEYQYQDYTYTTTDFQPDVTFGPDDRKRSENGKDDMSDLEKGG